MRRRIVVFNVSAVIDVILPVQRTRISSGILTVSILNSGNGMGVVATVGLLALKIEPIWGISGSLNGVGGPRANAAKTCGRIKIGLAELTYNTPSVGKVKRDFSLLSLQPYCSFAYSTLAYCSGPIVSVPLGHARLTSSRFSRTRLPFSVLAGEPSPPFSGSGPVCKT